MDTATKTPCKICNTMTPNLFNINFKPVPICEDCADLITIQQIEYVIKNKKKKD